MIQNNSDQPHVVVVGGGIAGLSAAWSLAHPELTRDRSARAVKPRLTLLEATPFLGGKIRTSEFAGSLVEEGPDAFLARVPWATHLCHQLGLEDKLISPAQQQALLWNKQLQPFPTGTVLGVPGKLWPLMRARSISLGGIFRASGDYFLPASVGADNGAMTVSDTIGKRLGSEILYTLVDPLLGGINGGSVDSLSLAAAAPHLGELATTKRSLLRSVRAQTHKIEASDEPQPVFYATRGGLSVIVEALQQALEAAGVVITTQTPVDQITQQPSGTWTLRLGDQTITADAVVLATPASQSSKLLSTTDETAAQLLAQIRYASVAMVRLSYHSVDVGHPLAASGFVVPAKYGRLSSACSFVSSKWPSNATDGRVTLRVSTGRSNDRRFLEFADDELVDAIHLELANVLKIRKPPLEADVIRWPDSFPQYEVGHIERVQELERRLARQKGIALAGAAYSGIGIPACIRSGSQAADRLLEFLGHKEGAPTKRQAGVAPQGQG